RRDFNLLLHPIVIRRLTLKCGKNFYLRTGRAMALFQQAGRLCFVIRYNMGSGCGFYKEAVFVYDRQ
ncbi:MAG TPA: hypothetical protein PLU43_10335, partial [Lachnospiraceae bacterium]|nr:hypothetical protein [Lachnospiraceae bacterium]